MMMSHRNVQPHVSIIGRGSLLPNPERTLLGCADPCLRGSVHPISVLDLMNTEVVGREGRYSHL